MSLAKREESIYGVERSDTRGNAGITIAGKTDLGIDSLNRRLRMRGDIPEGTSPRKGLIYGAGFGCAL